MPITPPPVAPDPNDPVTYPERGDALMAWLPVMVGEYNDDMDSINGSVSAAQAAAAAAAASAGTTASSTTSTSLGTGAKTLTIQTGKVFVAGQWVVIAQSANPANQMIARIEAYNSATGQLDVTAVSASGTGTVASWVIGLTPAPDTNALPKTGGTMTGAIAEMGNDSSIKDPDGVAQPVGYRGVPLRAASSQQTLAFSDAGRGISITTGGVIVPTNAAVPFAIGDLVTIYNNSGSTQQITAAAGVTLRLNGSSTTGTRTIALRGVATLMKVATNEWVAMGNVT